MRNLGFLGIISISIVILSACQNRLTIPANAFGTSSGSSISGSQPGPSTSPIPLPSPSPTPTKIYTGLFSATGSLQEPRIGHAAVVLPDGKVFLYGGNESTFTINNMAEVYDPVTHISVFVGPELVERVGPSVILLNNGKILIAGGADRSQATVPLVSSAELFDPATGKFTATGSLNTARAGSLAVTLDNGKILIPDGNCLMTVHCPGEIYDPAVGTFSLVGNSLATSPSTSATLLNNGKVLLLFDGGARAQLYDSNTGMFKATAGARANLTQTMAIGLANGQVLALSGFDNQDATTNTAQIYDPNSDTFTTIGNMKISQAEPALVELQGGKILITGGVSGAAPYLYLSSAEVYDPVTQSFSLTGSMTAPRSGHSSVSLLDGTILISGGLNGPDHSPASTQEIYQ